MNPFPLLTDRERQIALLIAIGESRRQIARQLGISEKTVDTHRASILQKLRVPNAVQLARLAIGLGYVSAIEPWPTTDRLDEPVSAGRAPDDRQGDLFAVDER